jgi:hypothetical protein
MLAGIARTGSLPLPYRKTAETPNLGGIDQSDDIRGGMGFEGLQELARFVQEGGTLITEGSTATLMAEYNLAGGVTIERPQNLFVRGSILRGVFADLKSPIAYGYEAKDLPIYFNQEPVLNVAGGTGFGGRGGAAGAGGAGAPTLTPNAAPLTIAPLEGPAPQPAPGGGRGGRGGGGTGGGRGGLQTASAEARPRVILQFAPNAANMLLSGTLAGGEALANRAAVVDMPMGKGHVVLFAIRPFWRWQTHGTYSLGFNAILNWNHLDAGRPEPSARPATSAGGQ